MDLTRACASDYVHECVCAWARACVCVCVCACVCVCVFTSMYVLISKIIMFVCVRMVYVCACVCVLQFFYLYSSWCAVTLYLAYDYPSQVSNDTALIRMYNIHYY